MKVAASPRIYTGRCPKVVFKLQVTRHQSLGTPNPKPLIPSYQSRVTSHKSTLPISQKRFDTDTSSCYSRFNKESLGTGGVG